MISIITPSFRQIDYLKRCARSVEDQAGEVEHIIQDGGSGEDFLSWASTQSFASICYEADSGMYDAINRGFLKAKGDILAWLNCDEQYLPGVLNKVRKWFLENPDKDILFGDVILISPDGKPLSYRKAIMPMRGHMRHCFLSTYSAATFVRKKVIEEGDLLDVRFKCMADLVWIDKLISKGRKAGVLNEAIAVFTQTGQNLGQYSKYVNEGEVWKQEIGIRNNGLRHIWAFVHRARKFFAGCYQRRDLEIKVYIDGDARVSIKSRVGGGWKNI